MNRDSFFNRKPATLTFDVDGFGTVTVKKLSQAEVETLQRKYRDETKALDGLTYIVNRCVVDESGSRVFADADMSALSAVDFDIIKAIAERAMKFSGLDSPKADAGE